MLYLVGLGPSKSDRAVLPEKSKILMIVSVPTGSWGLSYVSASLSNDLLSPREDQNISRLSTTQLDSLLQLVLASALQVSII
jgi:hypothetical protein